MAYRFENDDKKKPMMPTEKGMVPKNNPLDLVINDGGQQTPSTVPQDNGNGGQPTQPTQPKQGDGGQPVTPPATSPATPPVQGNQNEDEKGQKGGNDGNDGGQGNGGGSQGRDNDTPQKPTLQSNYEDIYNMYMQPALSPEEEARRKRGAAAAEGVGHLGNVLNAFSNLFFVNQGAPNMELPKVAPTELQKFEERVAEQRRKYVAGQMAAKGQDYNRYQSDMDQYWKEKSDKRADRTEGKADERWNREFERQNKWHDEAREDAKEVREESKRQFNANQSNQAKYRQDMLDAKRTYYKTMENRSNGKIRGKQMIFSDGDKNELAIYENVWKPSMQAIYDTIAKEVDEEMKKAEEEGRKPTVGRMPSYPTAKEKEDFVKQNWYKFPTARATMLALSKIDPANVENKIEEEGEEGRPLGSSIKWKDENNEEEELDW